MLKVSFGARCRICLFQPACIDNSDFLVKYTRPFETSLFPFVCSSVSPAYHSFSFSWCIAHTLQPSMSGSPISSLLRHDDDNPQPSRSRGAGTIRSARPGKGKSPPRSTTSDESTPLLSRVDDATSNDGSHDEQGYSSTTARSITSSPGARNKSQKASRWRWPIISALSTLLVVVIAILCLGFATPAAVQEYAQQAAVFEPLDLSVETFTKSGVEARVKGNFRLDSSRVAKKSVRDLGRFGTWIAAAIETKPTVMEISFPEYGNIVVGTVEIPRVVLSTIDGRVTHVDLLTEVKPGQIDGIRRVAMDWAEGRLGQVRIQGKADIGLLSGIFSLGTQRLSHTLTLQSKLRNVCSYKLLITASKTPTFLPCQNTRSTRSMSTK